MEFGSIFHDLNISLQVFFIDLILSGDNALVIAIACRSLPPRQMRRAMLIGITGAIVLRCLLTSFASFLMNIPLMKIIGGAALAVIAIKLMLDEAQEEQPVGHQTHPRGSLASAVTMIVIADITMSVDHVIGLAAVTQGSTVFLILGLLMSVPLMMFGSFHVMKLLQRFPWLIHTGAALLGWLAGDIAITDPLIIDWVNVQSPALTVVVPVLVAVFVLVEARIIQQAKEAITGPSPATGGPSTSRQTGGEG